MSRIGSRELPGGDNRGGAGSEENSSRRVGRRYRRPVQRQPPIPGRRHRSSSFKPHRETFTFDPEYAYGEAPIESSSDSSGSSEEAGEAYEGSPEENQELEETSTYDHLLDGW